LARDGFAPRIQPSLNHLLILTNALSFLAYGTGCFFSRYIRSEFERYGLASERPLVGILQLLAALGQFTGLLVPVAGIAACSGLALMMLVAIHVRIRVKDSLPQTLPAILYFLLNVYLSLKGF
jgi:hypothetical protein